MERLNCTVHLVIADDLEEKQLERACNGEGCRPFNDESIEDILDGFREKLQREKEKYNGYVVFAWEC